MSLKKDSKGHGMPWEDSYGYAQALKVGSTIYVSGQLSHDDDGNMVGAAPLDEEGKTMNCSCRQGRRSCRLVGGYLVGIDRFLLYK